MLCGAEAAVAECMWPSACEDCAGDGAECGEEILEGYSACGGLQHKVMVGLRETEFEMCEDVGT